jgi:hypothetical protein
MATRRPLSEYAAEQEANARTRQVPNAPAVQRATPMSETDQGSGFKGAAKTQYSRANEFAGVRPQDEIAGEFARGNYGNAAYNALVGKPGIQAARTLLSGPKGTAMGGSLAALDANRQQYDQGILAGQDQNARGEGIAMAGADLASLAGDMGMGAYGAGMGIAGLGAGAIGSGFQGQNSMLGQSLQTAGMDVGSVARQQQQIANDQIAGRMMAQAAAARGGNQAAAMRNAGMQASANQLQTNQQLALMRQQEMVDRRNAQLQAQQFAASQYGDRAALGFSGAAQGLGAATNAGGLVNQAGSTIGGIGGNIMGSGTQNTGNFLDAEVTQNAKQAEIDQKHQEAKAAHRKGIMDMIGKGASMMGGGG